MSVPVSIFNEAETPDVLEEIEISDGTGVGFESKVILFNDEWHSFDQVIDQIIKAVKCSYEKAEKLTWEVHTKGKTIVYSGEFEECLRVSSVLEEISLKTQIEV